MRGSTLHSDDGALDLQAKNNITITSATETEYSLLEENRSKKGLLQSSSSHLLKEDSFSREKGSLLSGNTVNINAGNDLAVKGSSVVGTGDVTLQAGNNVDIIAATESESRYLLEEKKKSGLMGAGGIGFTIGTTSQRHEVQEDATTHSQSFSTLGSTSGNVNVTAGNQLHIGGADLVAGKDLNLTGDSVIIDPGHDKRTTTETFESKSTGLTVALSGVVGSALNGAISAAKSAKESGDDRLAALQATKAVLSGVQAVQGGVLANMSGDPNNGVGVSISLSTQKSTSVQRTDSETVSGSTLNAGNNLAITATGKNKGDGSGDIVIAGSQLKAGHDTVLDAANDVMLTGAANTQSMTGKNSSSGGGVGVSIGVGAGNGGGSAGISVFANVNAASGKENGSGTVWSETTLDSGGTTRITSGRDTVLDGAQVSGEKVVADVGRDLLMRSQQDNNDYKSKQTSVAAGGSFTFGSMSGSGYISVNQDKMTSTYKSVQEQTGIFAGKEGFDLTVGNHTQLDGAVIASTATADKNHLDTGTLGFSNIGNEADFKTEHTGISLSGAGDFGGDTFKGNMPGGMLSGGGNSGHAEGTTKAAVAEGSITIRDADKQKQNVSELSRDTANANGSIGQIFDKEKEQNRLAQTQLIGEIGGQVADIARTQGDINGLSAAKKEHPGLSADDLRKTDTYKKEMNKYGTGSAIQQGIQAATAAVQGLAGGNVGQALTGAAAPYLAEQIHKLTENDPAAKAIAHAVVGAVTSYAAGNNALAGAAGAVSGELMAKFVMDQLYPGKKVSDLSEDEKQTISILGTLAAGLAGGVVGDSTANAIAGGQAGKNAVENNWLHVEEAERKAVLEHKERAGTITQDEKQELSGINQTNTARDQAIEAVCTDGNKGGSACAALVGPAQEALKKYGENVTYSLLYKDLYPQDAQNLESVLQGLDAGSIGRDQAITAIAKASRVSWETAASRYDKAMQTQALVSTLAGYYGSNSLNAAGKNTSAVSSQAEKIKENVAASQKGRESSNFGQYSKAEGALQETLGIWPPNRGAYGPVEQVTLPTGTVIDRYGSTRGTFTSPAGVPFENRALPSYSANAPYNVYEVLKPINDVSQSKILPWFGQPGQGTQYELPKPVQWYLDNKYLGEKK